MSAPRPPPPPEGFVPVGATNTASPQAEGTLDVCFVLDATSSMGQYLGMATAFGKTLYDYFVKLKALKTERPDLNIAFSKVRISVVAYRDVGDTPKVETLPFTEDFAQYRAFTDRLRPQGGSDYAEDLSSGLTAAIAMDWMPKGKSEKL